MARIGKDVKKVAKEVLTEKLEGRTWRQSLLGTALKLFVNLFGN